MPRREDELLVADIRNGLNKILQYTNGLTYEQFIAEEKTLDAVIRNFEIVGEAANILSHEFKINNSKIDWRGLTDFRNVLIHNYFGIDYHIVWVIIQNDVQKHIDLLDSMLNEN